VRRLVVVPDGPLHGLGWASLRDPSSGQLWAERAAIAVAPCLPLGALPVAHGAPSRAVVVGNPAFDRLTHPDLPDLPGAAREAASVASAYSSATLLTGAEATADRLLSEAEHADVLHVAAHGLVDSLDEARSALVLAPGGVLAPDGLLLPDAIRERRLDRLELVVLAACRSGDGRRSRFEGPLSLARPFLEAGAGAVLVSLFDLPDRSSAAASLHARLREGGSVAEAFRRVTVECWEGPSPDPLTCGGLQLIVHPARRGGGD
jgi:CHAT domain-containing protein